MPIADAPDRPLQHRTAHDGGEHEHRHAVGIQSDAVGVDRQQAPERTHRQARQSRADGCHRRQCVQRFQSQARDMRHFGRNQARGHHRHHCRTDQDRRQREHRRRARIADGEQDLAQCQRRQIDRHVDRKHPTAPARVRLGVEPAFDHRIQADQRRAGHQAQQAPAPGVQPDRMQQHRNGCQRRIKRKCADMADAANQRWCKEGAEKEAGEVAGHDQPQRPRIEAGLIAAHGEQGAEQPATGEQQGNAKQ